MRPETARAAEQSTSIFHGQTHPVIDEEVIDLDEDLFPLDGSDDLEAYVDVRGDELHTGMTNGYATEPPWRRIERFKDQRRLHRELEGIV